MSTEQKPSTLAVEAAHEIIMRVCGSPDSYEEIIQQAIDAATKEKDVEITKLKQSMEHQTNKLEGWFDEIERLKKELVNRS